MIHWSRFWLYRPIGHRSRNRPNHRHEALNAELDVPEAGGYMKRFMAFEGNEVVADTESGWLGEALGNPIFPPCVRRKAIGWSHRLRSGRLVGVKPGGTADLCAGRPGRVTAGILFFARR